MDLCGPIHIRSLGGSLYIFVIVDNYSRFTWVIFLRDKTKAFIKFTELCRKLQISKHLSVVAIKTNHGREFNQGKFIDYCDKNDISHNLLVLKTLQQNRVVERKIGHWKTWLEP